MSKTKFVPASGMVINATRTIVVRRADGWALARHVGGKASRTGKTIEPLWVEVGACQAYREDAIPGSVWEAAKDFAVFSGHGSSVTGSNIITVPCEAAAAAFIGWCAWREGTSDVKPRAPAGVEWIYTLARRASRRYGGYRTITEGEAYALSRYDNATLVVEQIDDKMCMSRLRAGSVWAHNFSDTGRWLTLYENEPIEGWIDGEEVSWCFRATGPEINDAVITIRRSDGTQLELLGVNPFDYENPGNFDGFAASPQSDNGDEFVEVSDE